MKFDYYLLNTYVPEADGEAPVLYKNWLEQAVAADLLGYEILWLTEHHFRTFGGMLPNPHLLLSAISSITKKIRLGTAVSTLPLHDPIQIAEDFAMLDNLSGGRVECGFGRGMSLIEYEVFGADSGVAQDALEEGVGLIELLWRKHDFTWHGEHFRCDRPINLLPPVLQNSPRIWMTANRSPEHFDWIGQHGYDLMTLPWMFPSYEEGRNLIEVYLRARKDAGYVVEDCEVLGMFPAYVAESSTAAHEVAESGWAEWRKLAKIERGGADEPAFVAYNRMVDDSRGIFGDPEECKNHLSRLADELGLTRVALVQHFGGIAQQNVLSSMELFATKVTWP